MFRRRSASCRDLRRFALSSGARFERWPWLSTLFYHRALMNPPIWRVRIHADKPQTASVATPTSSLQSRVAPGVLVSKALARVLPDLNGRVDNGFPGIRQWRLPSRSLSPGSLWLFCRRDFLPGGRRCDKRRWRCGSRRPDLKYKPDARRVASHCTPACSERATQS